MASAVVATWPRTRKKALRAMPAAASPPPAAGRASSLMAPGPAGSPRGLRAVRPREALAVAQGRLPAEPFACVAVGVAEGLQARLETAGHEHVGQLGVALEDGRERKPHQV